MVATMVGKLKRFPFSTTPRTWETEDLCFDNRDSLLPYYFKHDGRTLGDSSVTEPLFGKLVAGIDNAEEWMQTMGIHLQYFHAGSKVISVSELMTECNN